MARLMLRPPEPAPPVVEKLGPRSILISWETPLLHFPVSAYIVRVRQVGTTEWRGVNPDTGRLSKAVTGELPASWTYCTVQGLEEDVDYEAVLEFVNLAGSSPPSASSHAGRK